jgi:hypothetical protein
LGRTSCLLFILILFFSCRKDEPLPTGSFNPVRFSIDGIQAQNAAGVGLNPVILLHFDQKTDTATLRNALTLTGNTVPNTRIEIKTADKDSTVILQIVPALSPFSQYTLNINQTFKSRYGQSLSSELNLSFTTAIDTSDKFPVITDDSLLTLIQKQTFRYFSDFAHPVSGMARERNSSGDLVTTGGTGFGIMAIIAGINNGFISRDEGLSHIKTIADFLDTKATKYHGAFAHWIDGKTGVTIPFSQKDDGGDLVETSFLMAGLLCAREYFDRNIPAEDFLRQTITRLWHNVEWDWYTRGGSDALYWHWSPKYDWDMNVQVKGWNEALITYILAASSPTHPVAPAVYDKGWASNGDLQNGNTFYGIRLPLGPDFGGPLFFEHYSFLGIDPRKLKDKYADYNEQTGNHSRINQAYCISNPKKYYGYSAACWGLTASDTRNGYSAHSPTNDQGVISPTAALSSMPYTPEASLNAARFFYYKLGDKIWGQYGFKDAFSPHYAWVADSYLAIDQGPIIVMIENYKTGLIWNLTMKNADIRQGLTTLGFEY